MQQSRNIYHNILANYFSSQLLFIDGELQKKPNIRKCVEQPYQQTKAKLWDEVTDTLCNLDFIQAKSSAKMTYDLVDDFNTVLKVIPDNAENISQEKARQEQMEKYTRDLIACAKGKIKIEELDIPESITQWTQEQIYAEILRIKTNTTRSDKLKDFLNFLGQEADNLEEYAEYFKYLTVQQAWNWADSGPVGSAAQRRVSELKKSLLLCIPQTRPNWNPLPQAIKNLKEHEEAVTAVAITPDGKKAISGSVDKTCILWDLVSGKSIYLLNGHEGPITSVAMTPDGEKAVTASSDNTCIFWDLKKGQKIKTLFGHSHIVTAVAITPDGKLAISGSRDKTCILWDLHSKKVLKILEGHTEEVTTVAFINMGQNAISGSRDGTYIIWNLKSEKLVKSVTYSYMRHHFIIPISWDFKIKITPNDKNAISSLNDSCIVWNFKKYKKIRTLKGLTPWVTAVDITSDGKKAICSIYNKTCFLWDLKNGQVINTLTGHTDTVKDVAITPDGKRAISGSRDKTCILWDLNACISPMPLIGHTDQITTISITPNGKWLITCSKDYSCIIWDLKTGRKIKTLMDNPSGYITSLSLAQDGKNVLVGTSDYECIILNLCTGERIKTLKGHSTAITTTLITPDGRRAISGAESDTIFNETCIIWDLDSGQMIYSLDFISKVNSIALTPDGKRFILGSDINWSYDAVDQTCTIFDLEKGEELKALKGHKSGVTKVAITPDGKIAVSGSSDCTCIIWDLHTNQMIKIIHHNYYVNIISITPDGKKVITSSSDGICSLWDIRTGQEIYHLENYTTIVNDIAVTPDGKKVAFGSENGATIIWDLETYELLGPYLRNSEITSIAFFDDGLIVGDCSGKISFLNSEELNKSIFGIVTIRHIWDFKSKEYLQLSADCPFCGYRFSPEQKIIDTISVILINNNIEPEDSPCIKLVDEAWEHPGLISECPSCGEKLKFNPFIAGGDN